MAQATLVAVMPLLPPVPTLLPVGLFVGLLEGLLLLLLPVAVVSTSMVTYPSPAAVAIE